MDPSAWVPIFIQLGVGGVMLFMFNQVVSGKLRTLQEMEARKEALEAEQARTKRAEEQTDKLLPAMQELTTAVKKMIDTHTMVLDHLEQGWDLPRPPALEPPPAPPPRGRRTTSG
jgi:hypothetical protein